MSIKRHFHYLDHSYRSDGKFIVALKINGNHFSLQTTLVTREKQLEAWSRLVIDYCQFHKIYTLNIADISNSELFINANLNRKLSPAGVRAVFDYLEHKS